LQSIPGRERGQALFFELTRSVTDLYAEAKSEFEANQATRGQRWAERGERAEDIVSQRSVARDARGRFVKRSPA
jgi:hypothetical protein